MFINAHRYPGNLYEDLEEEFEWRHIAGREYGNVMMLLDSSFRYDEEGHLRDIPEPDPEHPYPNIFDSRITRVRDHLALVIVDAPELLDRVLTIID